MQSPLTDILSPGSRKVAYAVFATVGILLGAVQVGFGAAGMGQPSWLVVVLAVYSFLGGALGLTALSNVRPTSPSVTSGVAGT